MIDGERRGYQAGAEAILPLIAEAQHALPMPTDQELGQWAATAWAEYQARGAAHIEPREAFLRGFAMACRYLLATQRKEAELG
jgi:hypothetical protein